MKLVQILTIVSLSVHIEVSKDNVYGAPNENGSWNGLFGQLQRGVPLWLLIIAANKLLNKLTKTLKF